MAYTSNGLNLLATGHLQQKAVNQKPQLPPVPLQQMYTNFGHLLLTPQYVTNQQEYFGYNRAFLNTPFGQHGYIHGQPFTPQVVATIPALTPAKTPIAKKPAGRRSNTKDREPTTRKPQGSLDVKPPKLQAKPAKIVHEGGDFKTDVTLLKAVEEINPEYVIEDIINVPGKHVLSTKAHEDRVAQTAIRKHLPIKKSVLQTRISTTATETPNNVVKVEATGKTSTMGNIPEIPFNSYFLPYFSQNEIQQQQTGKKPAALILEPHSKAVVGNGGTAISTPISKAFLKRGVTTNVYFNPESVAIAGVGGKAHAQADLELDLIT